MSWWDIPKHRCPIIWILITGRCNFWIALDGVQLVIHDHGWISCNTVVSMSFKPLTKYRYSNKASSFKGILCSANPTGHRAAVKNSDVPKPPSGKAARKPLTRTGSADSTMLFIRKRLSTRRCAIENGSYNEFKTYDIVIWQMKNMNVHIGMYQLYPYTYHCNTVVFVKHYNIYTNVFKISANHSRLPSHNIHLKSFLQASLEGMESQSQVLPGLTYLSYQKKNSYFP